MRGYWMRSDRPDRRLLAILASDMVDYSRLMEADEVQTLSRLKQYRQEVIDPMIDSQGGRIIKTTGDGLLVEFPGVVDAVECAVGVQQAIAVAEAEVLPLSQISFRIGINIGDVIIDGDDIYGDGVNIAARLEGMSEPGGICLSSAAYETLRGKTDLTFEDLGSQRLKNIARSINVWRWRRSPVASLNARFSTCPNLTAGQAIHFCDALREHFR